MLDILSSIAGLIILSTLFLVIAIAIKKEVENGPVFFSQIRIGKMEKNLKCVNFGQCVWTQKKSLKNY